MENKLINFKFDVTDEQKEKILLSVIFERWHTNIVDKFDVRSIAIRDVVWFGERVGFLLVEADAYFEGRKVPGIAFLRGDSVSIMPIFSVENKKELYTALVIEPRIPIGENAQPSLPAGMIDDQSFESAAIKELGEELGTDIKVSRNDLIFLDKFPLSCGGSDEYMSLFYFDYNLSEEQFKSLDGRITGENEYENIKVKLIPVDQLIHIQNLDARSTLSYYLWRNKIEAKEHTDL